MVGARRIATRAVAMLVAAAIASACTAQALPGGAVTPAPAATFAIATSAPLVTPSPGTPLVRAKYLVLAPDAAHLTSSGPAGTPVLDITVKDARRATALLQLAARLEPAVLRWCPMDQGYAFSIEWWQGARIVATAGLQAQGCADLSLDGSSALMSTPEFWQALADLFGLTDAQLHPPPV